MKVKVIGTRPIYHPFPLFSYLIRLVDWCSFSHVGLLLVEENKVFHAHFKNISLVSYEEYQRSHEVKKEEEYELTEEEYLILKAVIHRRLGKQPNSCITMIGAIIPLLSRRWFQIKMRNVLKKGYSCSWLIADTFHQVKGKGDPEIDYSTLGVKHLFSFIKKLTSKTK